MTSKSDSRWLLAYALILSLVDDLAATYKKGLWETDPLEILLHDNVRVGTKDRERCGFWYAHDLAREFNSQTLDKLMNFIEVETGGTIIVTRDQIVRKAKDDKKGRSNRRDNRTIVDLLA